MKRKQRITNISIVTLLILNISFLALTFFKPKHKTIHKVKLLETDIHLPQPPPEMHFTKEELDEAVYNMNLPVWARSYKHCNDPQSEVSCSQIVRAWRCIQRWEAHVNSTSYLEDKLFISEYEKDGIGNHMNMEAAAFVIALYLNRTFVIGTKHPQNGSWIDGDAYDVANTILQLNDSIRQHANKIERKRNIGTHLYETIYMNNYDYFDFYDLIFSDFLMYISQIYMNDNLSLFAYENFGLHCGYFVSNYVSRIPEMAINTAKEAYSKVPADARVIGVHLRFQFAGQFYSTGIERTMEVASKFLRSKMDEMPTFFAFASDSKEMEEAFMREFGNRTITAPTVRQNDFDHESALNDFALLEMADELLLSYRSTFSFMTAVRTLKRAYFIEKESDEVFAASNSQAGSISMLFHNWDQNDWEFNRRIPILRENEAAMRNYTRFLVI